MSNLSWISIFLASMRRFTEMFRHYYVRALVDIVGLSEEEAEKETDTLEMNYEEEKQEITETQPV